MRMNSRSLIVLPSLLTVAALAHAAHAQPFEDPGFGDPTTLTKPIGTTLPVATMPNGQPLAGSYGPTPPNTPGSPVRPSSWPGGVATPLPGTAPMPPDSVRTAMVAPPAVVEKTSAADPPYDPAEIIARVGSERIQACEVLPMINRAINNAVKDSPEFAALPPEDKQRELFKAQRGYMQAALKEMITTKLLVAELRGSADKKALDENEKKIRDHFNNEYMKHMLKEYDASSIIELENKLRDLGGSIETQRALFVEQNLAQGWLGQAVRKEDKSPTHDDMLAYYKAHGAEWDTPARARWEQLTAKWASFNSRPEAIAALARWGDDVMLRRIPLAEVAKAHSQDYAADEGGVHDWANKGSLRSTTIDEAIFTLPVGALSRIIEDEDGCHIVRVIEREDARREPFIEVQPEIKKALHDGGEGQRRKVYLDKLRKTTPVWTVFDEPQTAQAPATTSYAR
jgi:hypothetical protein